MIQGFTNNFTDETLFFDQYTYPRQGVSVLVEEDKSIDQHHLRLFRDDLKYRKYGTCR